MKTVLLLGCITALCAASSVTISTTSHSGTDSRAWWADDAYWTPTRFPRGGDVVEISEDMTYEDDDRLLNGERLDRNGPTYYYDGATEGSDIIIDEGIAFDLLDGDMTIGGQDDAPVHCIEDPAGWGSWMHDGVVDGCSAFCDGGQQTRSRTVTPPRYGGDACPESIQDQPCNEQACACTTDSGVKASGDMYPGFAKNHCNECKCLHGTETCTERVCHDNRDTTLCGHTTCVYGALFPNDETVYTAAEVATKYPSGTVPSHELTTLVRHSDADTGAFHCGHDGADCKCYCSDAGTHTIWHRAIRHQDAIDNGLTMAGCTCDSAGCDATTHLCTFVPGSCSTSSSAVTSHATKDVCGIDGMLSHHKILVSDLS